MWCVCVCVCVGGGGGGGGGPSLVCMGEGTCVIFKGCMFHSGLSFDFRNDYCTKLYLVSCEFYNGGCTSEILGILIPCFICPHVLYIIMRG